MKGSIIITLYVVICLGYIFWSDSLVFYLAPDMEQTRYIQTIKGTVFVLVTGVFLGFLIHRHNRHQVLVRRDLEDSLRQSQSLAQELQRAMGDIETSNHSLETKSDALKRSNDDLNQFAYVVSHDLQEPLRMVTSYLQLLERRYKDELDSDAREFIYFAVDGARRMQAQIRSLLEYSRLSTRGQAFTRVDLRDAVNDALQNLSLSLNEKGVDLCVDSLPRIHGDPVQLSILFQNLLSNVLKHATKGGKDTSPRVDIYSSEKPHEYLICVEDNGPGFEQRFSERIFEIFQRLSKSGDGTGIGLALCKRIIERHGGRIWAESEQGKGTKIFFTLPRSPEA